MLKNHVIFRSLAILKHQICTNWLWLS